MSNNCWATKARKETQGQPWRALVCLRGADWAAGCHSGPAPGNGPVPAEDGDCAERAAVWGQRQSEAHAGPSSTAAQAPSGKMVGGPAGGGGTRTHTVWNTPPPSFPGAPPLFSGKLPPHWVWPLLWASLTLALTALGPHWRRICLPP